MKQFNKLSLFLGILLISSGISSSGLGVDLVTDWSFTASSWNTRDTDLDGYVDTLDFQVNVYASANANLTFRFEVFDVTNISIYSNTQSFYMLSNETMVYMDSFVSDLNQSVYVDITAWDSSGQVYFYKTPVVALWQAGSITGSSYVTTYDTGVDGLPDTIYMEGTLSWNNYDLTYIYNLSISFKVYNSNGSLVYSNTTWYFPTLTTDSFTGSYEYGVETAGEFTITVFMYANSVQMLYNTAEYVNGLVPENSGPISFNANFYLYSNSSVDDNLYIDMRYEGNLSTPTLIETYVNFYYWSGNGSYMFLEQVYKFFYTSNSSIYFDYVNWYAPMDADYWVNIEVYVAGVFTATQDFYWAVTSAPDVYFEYNYYSMDSDGDFLNDSVAYEFYFDWNVTTFPAQYISGWVEFYSLSPTLELTYITGDFFDFYTGDSVFMFVDGFFNAPLSGDYYISMYYYTSTSTWTSPFYDAYFYNLTGTAPDDWSYNVDWWTSSSVGSPYYDTVSMDVSFDSYNNTYSKQGGIEVMISWKNLTTGSLDTVFYEYVAFTLSPNGYYLYTMSYTALMDGYYTVFINGTVGGDYFREVFDVYLETNPDDYSGIFYNIDVTRGNWDNIGLDDFAVIDVDFNWTFTMGSDIEFRASLYSIDTFGNLVWQDDLIFNFFASSGVGSERFQGVFYMPFYGNFTIEFRILQDGYEIGNLAYFLGYMDAYTGPIIKYRSNVWAYDGDGDGRPDTIGIDITYDYTNAFGVLDFLFNLYRFSAGIRELVADQRLTAQLNGTGIGEMSYSFLIPSDGDYAVEIEANGPNNQNLRYYADFSSLSAYSSASTSDSFPTNPTDSPTTSTEVNETNTGDPSSAPPEFPVPFAFEYALLAFLAIPILRRKR